MTQTNIDVEFEKAKPYILANIAYIAFGGKARSGKSYAKAIVTELFGSSIVEPVSFSDPIKRALRNIFGWKNEAKFSDNTPTNVKEGLMEKFMVSPRTCMQTLGTEWGRDMINPNIWVLLYQNATSYKTSTRLIVTDDVRFQNEIGFIKSQKSVTIYIEPQKSKPSPAKHRSEDGVSQSDFEYSIINDFVPANLTQQLKSVLTEHVRHFMEDDNAENSN